MRYILSLTSGFIIGIIVSSFILSDATLLFFLLLSIVLFLYVHFFEKETMRIVGFIVSLFFLGVFLGQFRVLVFNRFISHDLEQFESSTFDQSFGKTKQNISLVGKITEEPVSNGQTQKIVVDVTAMPSVVSSTKISGRILVTTELFPMYRYGDVVEIKGVVKKPEKIVEPDGRVFDYPAYLLKDKITHTISFGVVTSSGKNDGNLVLRFLYGIKEKFVHSIQKVLPEPHAGLLSGIILGTQTLSKDLSDSFRSAGLSHIIVLSGYNITIVAESVLAVALFFTPIYAYLIAVCSVVLFVLMSGAGASALRAGVMATVALLGKRFGKSYHAGRALFFAGFSMILWNPMTLLYDPSFHLSFLATIAIIYVSPIVTKKLYSVTERYGLKEILSTTLAVNLFVLPYILYMSGSVQLFSLPANMLVLPFVSLTMFLGFVVGVLGFFGRLVGLIFGTPSYIILSYDIFIAQTISKLPFAQISFSHFSLPLLILVYGVFFYFLYKKNHGIEQSPVHGLSSKIVTRDGYTVITDDY